MVRPGTEDAPIEDIDVIIVGNNGVSLFWVYGINAGQEVVSSYSMVFVLTILIDKFMCAFIVARGQFEGNVRLEASGTC